MSKENYLIKLDEVEFRAKKPVGDDLIVLIGTHYYKVFWVMAFNEATGWEEEMTLLVPMDTIAIKN